VRSASQADYLTKKFAEFKDHLELVLVPDLTIPHALDEHLKGIEVLVHTASPFTFSSKDPKTEVLDIAIAANENVLESALSAPSLSRLVVTSSYAAVMHPSFGVDHVYTDDEWNPFTYEQAITINDPVVYYVASKKLAEKAVYDIVEQKKPKFDVVTLNPPMVFGPFLHNATLATLNESTKEIWDIINSTTDTVPYTGIPAFVDVRDVALAHVRAVENPKAHGRYLLSSSSYTWQEVVDLVHKNFPEQKIVPVGKPGEYHPTVKLDHTKAHKELGIDFIPLEKTVKDTFTQLFELKAKLAPA